MLRFTYGKKLMRQDREKMHKKLHFDRLQVMAYEICTTSCYKLQLE